MTEINLDSEDLKVDYLSFNLQFNNPEIELKKTVVKNFQYYLFTDQFEIFE
jgi:hypothetical protein